MRATLVALAAGPARYLTRPGQCNLENFEGAWARGRRGPGLSASGKGTDAGPMLVYWRLGCLGPLPAPAHWNWGNWQTRRACSACPGQCSSSQRNCQWSTERSAASSARE